MRVTITPRDVPAPLDRLGGMTVSESGLDGVPAEVNEAGGGWIGANRRERSA